MQLRSPLPIALTGAAAHAALAPSGRGQVIAAFARSFYVEGDEGGLACIGPPTLGAGPLNALGAFPDGSVDVVIGDGVVVALDAAREWHPEPCRIGDVSGGLQKLVTTVQTTRRSDGFIPFITPLALGSGFPLPAPPPQGGRENSVNALLTAIRSTSGRPSGPTM